MKEKYNYLVIFLLMVCLLALAACDQRAEPEEAQYSSQIVCENKEDHEYIINIDSQKVHKITCGTGQRIKSENRRKYCGELDDLLKKGYSVCRNCFR